MAGVIKYSTTTPTNQSTLRKGNTVVAVGNDATSQFRANGFFSGIDIPLGGYVVYTIGLNNNPKMWTANTDSDLIPIARTLGGNPTTAADAKYYICSVTDAWILDNPINNIVTDGLVLALDAGNLSSYPEINSSFMDISGGGINGTLYNGPAFNPNGFLEFDGVDDYAIIGSANDIQFGTGDFTIEALFKPIDDGNGWTGVVAKGASGATGFAMNYYANGNGTVTLRMSITAPSNQHYSSGYLTSDKWYHIVMVFDRDTAGYVYNNGDLTYSHTALTSNNQTVDNSGYPLRLSTFDGGSWFLNGGISKVKLYNRTLSETEVLQNYYQAPIVTDGLVLALDVGNLVSYESGSTTTYSMTGSINGTLYNGIGFDSANGGFWEFDGVDDYLLPDDINYGNNNRISEMSVFAWVKTTFNSGTPGVWNNSNWSILDFDRSEVFTFTLNGTGEVQMSGADGVNNYFDIVGTQQCNDGNWHYVGWTYSSITNDILMYVDGGLDRTHSYANLGDLGTGRGDRWAVIGDGSERTSQSSTSRNDIYFKGSIGAIHFYDDKVLTLPEVLQNFNAQRSRFQ